ncbi:MAG TPA: rod-binding protein [Caulobacter sp.]|nr:rod-binding protein [Caulobacter sp.]
MAAPVALPADILLGQAQAATASTADLARKRKSEEAARSFEASFLSTMLQPMFEGLSTEAPFGGGQGEAMFKSFMTDAIAKQTAKRGGLGIGDMVQREMLKLQGLS